MSDFSNGGGEQAPSSQPINPVSDEAHNASLVTADEAAKQPTQQAVFPKDKTDSVAFSFDNVDPRVNILLNIDKISDRDPRFSGKPIIDYVKNWYRYFSGLKGVDKIDAFQNVNNLKGYRAVFINDINQTPNVDIFFEVPGNNDLVIHLANGNLDPSIFDKIVDSVKWTPKK